MRELYSTNINKQKFSGIPAQFTRHVQQPHSMQVESGLQSALNLHTVRLFTESDDTRACNNQICPPEDEQGAARNMLRIVM